jgi:hypothetical protein
MSLKCDRPVRIASFWRKECYDTVTVFNTLADISPNLLLQVLMCLKIVLGFGLCYREVL